MKCDKFRMLQCIQCLDMGDVSFGSVQRVGVKGHNNIATLQHGQPDQLKLQNSKTRCFKRLLSSSCKLHKRLDQRLLGLLSLNLIQNQILHQILPQ